jgi:hypothetical protein
VRERKTLIKWIQHYFQSVGLKIKALVKAQAQDQVSCLWNNHWVFRNLVHVQVFKSRNKEFLNLWNYFLNKLLKGRLLTL